jgi:hypothetical protein
MAYRPPGLTQLLRRLRKEGVAVVLKEVADLDRFSVIRADGLTDFSLGANLVPCLTPPIGPVPWITA